MEAAFFARIDNYASLEVLQHPLAQASIDGRTIPSTSNATPSAIGGSVRASFINNAIFYYHYLSLFRSPTFK
jgi:hypothetical protein